MMQISGTILDLRHSEGTRTSRYHLAVRGILHDAIPLDEGTAAAGRFQEISGEIISTVVICLISSTPVVFLSPCSR
jgi:hypothetical protein